MRGQHRDITGRDLHISKIRIGHGSPAGVVTPSVEGELYGDLDTGAIYISNDTDVQGWMLSTGGGMGGSGAMVLLPANDTRLGGVKGGGQNIVIDEDGTIHAVIRNVLNVPAPVWDYPLFASGLDTHSRYGQAETSWIRVAYHASGVNDLDTYIVRSKKTNYESTAWTNMYTADTSFTFHGMEPNTDYDFEVAVRDINFNVSPWSNTITLKTPKDNVAPNIISNLAVSGGYNAAILKWSPNTETDIQGYEIYCQPQALGDMGSFIPDTTTFSNRVWSGAATSATVVLGRSYPSYYFKACAIDHSGNRSGFASAALSLYDIVPTRPNTLTLTAGYDLDSFNNQIFWIKAEVDDIPRDSTFAYYEYQIKISDAPSFIVFPGTNSKTFKFSPVLPNTEYTVGVRAVDELGNRSIFTDDVSITTNCDITPPGYPENVTVTNGIGMIFLSWSNPIDQDLKHIELRRWQHDGDPFYVPPATGADPRSTLIAANLNSAYFDKNIIEDTVYFYWLRAIDTSDNHSDWTYPVSGKGLKIGTGDFDTTIPDAPHSVSGTSVTEIDEYGNPHTSATFTWGASNSPDIVYYEWRLKEGSGGVYINGTVSALSCLLKPLKANTNYYFGVRAVDKLGNKSNWTSDYHLITTKDNTIPVALTLNAPVTAFKSVFLNWSATADKDISRVDIYRLQSNEAVVSPSGSTKIGESRGTSFVDGDVTSGTKYWYWAKAIDTSDNMSDWSNGVNAIPALITTSDVNFAAETSSIYQYIPILENETFFDNTPTQGWVSWNQHTVYLNGMSYTIPASSTNQKYITWLTTAHSGFANRAGYTPCSGLPTLDDDEFIIGINASGCYSKNWDAIANQVIGSAFIVNGAIINAKIADAAIDDAKIANLTAQKITAGDIDAARMQLNAGTAVNNGSTLIEPGRIKITGSSTLSDWKNGSDSTEINGGKIAANTISANSLQIGGRNITFEGIQFKVNKSTNVVSWTNGSVSYQDASTTVIAVASGSAVCSGAGNTYQFYWPKDAASLRCTTNRTTAYNANNIVIGSYAVNGQILVVNYGKTIVDGSDITAGTISGNRLIANTITASQLSADNIIVNTTQIATGIITTAQIGTLDIGSAKVTGTLSAARLDADTIVSKVNSSSAATVINPGKIAVSGAGFTLANWIYGGNTTTIDGGAIATNTIKANSLEVGAVGLTRSGVMITYTYGNVLQWTLGKFTWTDYDAASGSYNSSVNISAGSVTWNAASGGGPLYLYWHKGNTTLSTTYNIADVYGNPLNVNLAIYRGGNLLVANYGKTLIDGQNIITGSIDANSIKAGSITAAQIQAGSLTADLITTGVLNAGTEITVGSMTIDAGDGSSNGNIRLGKASYNDLTAGFWLGGDLTVPKFTLGDSNTGIQWTGTKLNIYGPVEIGGTPDVTGGYNGGVVATEIGYRVELVSSNGLILRKTSNPSEVLTTLTPIVYKGFNNITEEIQDWQYKWTRVSPPPYDTTDAAWNGTHGQGYTSIDVTSNDVNIRATFNCQIRSYPGEF